MGNRISITELRPFELSNSKQLAIMPADADSLCRYVARRCPDAAAQILVWGALKSGELHDADADDTSTLTPPGMDERDLISRAIRLRRGQAGFRSALLDRHNGRCVISGCRVLGVLEAAHIRPYRGPADNHPSNGLILRSDLHTLF